MIKWVNNIKLYCEKKELGKCPVCGSADVQVEEHNYGCRQSFTFRCISCKATEHIDGFSENC